MNKRKVLIATPAYGSLITVNYLNGVIDLLTSKIDNWLFGFFPMGNEALIQRGRQFLAQYAVVKGYDKLLFIDADLGFTNTDIIRIINHNKPVVGGTYPVKRIPISLNFNPLPSQKTSEISNVHSPEGFKQFVTKYADHDGLIEVTHIPTGFMCVETSVFRQLAKVVPSYQSGKISGYPEIGQIPEVFPVRVKNGFLESEDWAFCSLCQDNGIKVYLDSQVLLTHAANIVLDVKTA
jgi:hypothetical protein